MNLPRVMFLCTGNSCRSQMAEGFARAAYGDRLDACSAGTRPQGLNRLAVRAMAEVGIDLTTHANSTIDDCDPQTIDLVITVCGHAHEYRRVELGDGAELIVLDAFGGPRDVLVVGAAGELEAHGSASWVTG